MRGLFRFAAPAAAATFLWTAALAQYGGHIHVPEIGFSKLALPLTTSRVNALAGDGANRIWVATPEGVSALAAATGADPEQPDSLFERATFFPFRQDDGLLADNVSAVTFAVMGNEEHFFLGFPTGLQYGRVLSTTGLSLPADSALFQGETSAERVNDLAAGSGVVWVATGGGLREWGLGSQSPQESTSSPYAEGRPVVAVAGLPDTPKVAAYATQTGVYLVESGGTPVALELPAGVQEIVDLIFDDNGNLWALGETNTQVVVWRYNTAALEEPQEAVPDFSSFLPDGVDPGDAQNLAVDPVQGAVWVAAGAQGAWFATTGGGGLSDWMQPTAGGQAVPPPSREVWCVFADPAGNVWFGTDRGVEALVARFLSIDSTRYLGYGTTVRVTVLDVAAAGSGAIEVEVNGASKEIPETENPGVFARTLRFSETGGPDAIQVASTSEDTPITFRYAYDPDHADRVLTATATWAHIEDFEDDFWIGGPCFIDTLVR